MQTQEVAWQSPSNIAIIKYWGKHGVQLPRNPSLSFTLSAAHTQTKLVAEPKEDTGGGISLDFYFEGQANALFSDKIKRFLSSIYAEYLPFLPNYHLTIHSQNSFPHSAGIASSASSMSALALALCQLEQKLEGQEVRDTEFYQKASVLSRLGSGSASRSVYGGVVVWGQSALVEGSSDQWAVPMLDISPVFENYQDTILIVSAGEKPVSSRAGHALMNTNRFASERFRQAQENLAALLPVLKNGDLETFVKITEEEALTLHALMMTSDPSYLLLLPDTLAIIEKVRDFRKKQGIPLCFTLDAGPNVHLLYPKTDREIVMQFIKEELYPHTQAGQWLEDQVGEGPQEML